VARVAAVRQAAGSEIPITVDANCGWDLTTARIALERLRPWNLLVAEQPIPPGDAPALAAIRSACGIPIMADESVFTLTDAWNVATARAADVISVYPGKNGGIAASIEIAHVAQAAGLCCHVGSNLELGIGSAAMLHLAAATAAIHSAAYPADIIGPNYHESDLLKEPLVLGPSVAQVPHGPGLGVELDDAALERFRAR
jgi:muconate cycloisomerase